MSFGLGTLLAIHQLCRVILGLSLLWPISQTPTVIDAGELRQCAHQSSRWTGNGLSGPMCLPIVIELR